MTPTELASLEALAKAEPVAWYWVAQQGSYLFPVWVMGAERPYEAPNNAMPLYAAPSNPAAILSLIDECKRMREVLAPFANMMPDSIEPKDALQRKLQEWCAAARAALEPQP